MSRSLLRSSSIYGVGAVLNKALGFFLIPLYTHTLATGQYGLLELLNRVADVLILLVFLGMRQAYIRFFFDRLPVHKQFYDLIAQGVSTGSTKDNQRNVADVLEIRADLAAAEQELLFDPQTSGGLLIAVATESAPRLLEALVASGHSAAEVGEVLDGPPRLEVA